MAIKKDDIHNLPLTIVVVKDPKGKGYTVFSKQFPDIIAVGDDEESAIDNLFEGMKAAFNYWASKGKEEYGENYKISKKELKLTPSDIV